MKRLSPCRDLVVAEVTRLKHPQDQSLLTSAATIERERYTSVPFVKA